MFLSGMLARGRTRVKVSPPAWLLRAARWLPAAAWMGGIFYLSHQATPLGAAANNISAFAAHLGLYAGLAVLFYWALSGGVERDAEPLTWVLTGVAFALTVLYGVVDELHQAFVPGRVASEIDLAVDAVGAALGIALALLATRLLKVGRGYQ